MGIGTKIKEALHGDKEQQHGTPDTSKTPGSFPSNEVPRSHAHQNTVGSGNVGTSSRLSDEKVPGSDSADYTYGSKSGPNATSGVSGGHSHGAVGTHQNTGLAHKNVPGTTTTTSSGGLTDKNHSDPYWGEKERTSRHEPGHGGGAYERTGDGLHAREVNDRYNNTKHHENFAQDGSVGRNSGHATHAPGTTSTYGSGAPEGTHGPHSSRVANAADPRVDSDRDNRGAPGSTGYGSGSRGTPEGVYGPHSSRAANAADPRVDSDRDHRGAPGSYGENDRFNTAGGATGTTSNLAHRPYDGTNSRREEKIREYDAPTNSSDRAHGGAGAGLVGGAAAGIGASKLADRHHQEDLRENDPGFGASRGNDAYDNVGSRERLSGAGSNDPHSFNSATKPGTGVGTSMLDPHGTSSGHHVGSHAGTGTHTGTGINAGSHLPGSQDPYTDREGYRGASAHDGGSNLPHQSHHNNTSLTGVPGSQSHGLGGSGIGHNNTSGGSSTYSQEGRGIGSKEYGPGHQGAKVMHTCANCGHDNDISQHFRNDAVYRMG